MIKMWLRLTVILALVVAVISQLASEVPPPGVARTIAPDEPSTFNNQYMALMPKVLRPGQMFDVSITHIDPPRDGTPVTVHVDLRAPDRDQTVIAEKDDSLPIATCVNPGPCPVTKVVSLQVPDVLDEHEYNVTVSGISGSKAFFNSSMVTVKQKVFSIFIQTDRAMYKPSQTVMFRVLAVDPDLKPVKTPLNISVHDLNDNRLKQWLNVESDIGVISRNFTLSDQPPLGDWYINVVGSHVGQRKSFEVAEYVLPKYEVTLDLPSFMLTTYKKITATVTAKYTYGQPVQGNCSLYVQTKSYLYYRMEKRKALNITQELVKGKADFEIKLTQLADLVPESYPGDTRTNLERMTYNTFAFSASCREDLTGKVFVKNGTVRVEARKFRLEWLPNTADNFKPGLIYKAYVQLKLADGTPPSVNDLTFPGNGSRMQIKLYDSSYRYGDDRNVPIDVADINDDGTALFMIKAGDDVDSLSLRVEFDDGMYKVSISKYVRKFKTRDGGALQIRLLDNDNLVEAGQEAEFNITTSTISSVINVQLLAKGELVRSEAVVFPAGMSHLYKLTVDDSLAQQLAPKARAVAWYMTDTNEIISDSVDFKVDGAFSNDVSLKFNTNMTKPGSDVEVTVRAESLSYVGLLAVDQSSLLLATGNDLTQDMVIDELETYDSINDQEDFYPPIMFAARAKRSIWCPWCYISTGGKDSNEVFKNSGMIYLTDIYVYVEAARPFYMFPMERGVLGPPLRGAAGPTGPPMAAAAPKMEADSGGASSSGLEQVSRVRTKFPETWLWTEAETGPDGDVNIKTQAPDTITSWVASAFAMHPLKGLGIAEDKAKITVFKPFFVSLDLPYSVIRGEQLELKIIVFNYLPESLMVSVKLKKSLEFAVEELNGIEFTHANVEATVQVDSNDGRTISLWIKPVVLGNIAIEVEARSTMAADAVRRMLLVEAEGAPQSYDLNFLIDVTEADLFVKYETLTLPSEDEGLVPGSVRIDATAIGDIMGPAMNNLNNLVKMPYGCGEQNMLNFAPNIFVMNYMKATGKTDSDLETKAINFMEKGYQRELTYQRSDGSFSAFGNRDTSGSTWLTAFVVKSFYQARHYISVDMYNLARSVNWVLEQQMKSGQFNEPGRVIHTDMQGGSASGVSLTAYVIISLSEMKDMEELNKERVTQAIDLAMAYLKEEMTKSTVISDPYIMSIITYALALNDDPDTEAVFNQLKDMAITEDGQTHWDKKKPVLPEKQGKVLIWQPPRHQAEASAIETTAYAMLSYVRLGLVADAVPIMRWLVSQRNSFGGYGSTQDTVMALQALASFGSISSSSGDISLDISVETSAGRFNFQRITPQNAIVLQKQQIGMGGFEDHLIVKALGQGLALVQVSVSYNLMQTSESQDIDLEVVSKLNNDNTVNVDICAVYAPKEPSGMVVIETSMLSGYQPTNIEELKESQKFIKRVDQDGKTYFFYLDELLTGQRTCLTVMTSQVNKVAKLQKAKVKAYPYYAPHQMKTSFYLPRALADVSNCNPAVQDCGDRNGLNLVYSDRQDQPTEIETIYRGHNPAIQRSVSAASTLISVSVVAMVTASLLVLIF